MRELGPLVAAADFHYDEKRVQVCWRELSQIPNLWETKKIEKTHRLGIWLNSLQLVSELGLKISGRVKDPKAHKMKTKGIFTKGGVDCSFVVIWYKKVCVMERLKINFMEFSPRWRLLGSVPNS